MDNDRSKDSENLKKEDANERPPKSKASRARNQTVMLTPEMTGQVRALLDTEEGTNKPDPLADLLPPLSGGFSTDKRAPSGRGQRPSTDYGSDIQSDSSHGNKSERKSTGKMQQASSTSRPQLVQNAAPAPLQMGAAGRSGVLSGYSTPSGASNVQIKARPKAKIIGFLVSFDQEPFGEIFEIRAGRFLLTSKPTEHGDFILINDETISPLHAILRATKAGQVQILDQLSEFGTGITRVGEEEEEDVAGSMVNAAHGDVVRFGERYFVICLVPQVKLPKSEKE